MEMNKLYRAYVLKCLDEIEGLIPDARLAFQERDLQKSSSLASTMNARFCEISDAYRLMTGHGCEERFDVYWELGNHAFHDGTNASVMANEARSRDFERALKLLDMIRVDCAKTRHLVWHFCETGEVEWEGDDRYVPVQGLTPIDPKDLGLE